MTIKPIGSNQTELQLDNGNKVLFSYETPVAAYTETLGYIKTTQKYSATTTKHVNNWAGYHMAVPQATIDNIANGGE